MKASSFRSSLLAFPSGRFAISSQQKRCLHKTRPAHEVPQPRPFIPDVHTFLTLIGRGMNKYATKFPSWESLFSLTSPELKQLGIEPPRNRKYLLHWMQRYRKGQLGPGGDFKYVQDGQALLKVATPPSNIVSEAKWVVNVPMREAQPTSYEAGDGAAEGDRKESPTEQSQQTSPQMDLSQAAEVFNVKGYTISGLRSIAGPFVTTLPGNSGAIVKVTEGMWEHTRGRKIDGGERRRGEVRFKKRSAARRAEREAETLASFNL